MRLIVSVLFLSFLTFSCSSKKNTIDAPVEERVNVEQLIKDGYVKGIVKDFSKDEGCGLLIVLDKDQQVIQPMKALDGNFFKDGFAVWVKYRPIRPIQPKCNKGVTVSIEGLKKG